MTLFSPPSFIQRKLPTRAQATTRQQHQVSEAERVVTYGSSERAKSLCGRPTADNAADYDKAFLLTFRKMTR